ncbi:ACT domain-containing protein [Qipengyuania qiaonensis]|uniref:ACT domain-containing protein n=1 Tax=Qipengyuania qiaonensis TaxID=2867240 RepID=A0ABS7J854_9SPHN|nr:ACT domain-containing protein [Qipengyuania qiaonensis]MBX7483503.1 ACT domain-containing protein [Qipengyuania qiaonensis]
MTSPTRDGRAMIEQMSPRLDERRWCFVPVTPDRASELLGAALGTFREDEGVSAIVPVQLASEGAPVFARIVLEVFSDLEGVGLTAAVSGVLAEAGIACNMVAALHHDHAFVPEGRAAEALEILKELAAGQG